MVVPKEERSRMETGVDRADIGLHLHPSIPIACHLRHCHLLVVTLPIHKLQGTDATHHDQLAALPLPVAHTAYRHHAFRINQWQVQLLVFAVGAQPDSPE
ncbi:unnamed protein product [Camellia sinensis]